MEGRGIIREIRRSLVKFVPIPCGETRFFSTCSQIIGNKRRRNGCYLFIEGLRFVISEILKMLYILISLRKSVFVVTGFMQPTRVWGKQTSAPSVSQEKNYAGRIQGELT